eukprot:2444772-Pyramimonas_sp.AAC.1
MGFQCVIHPPPGKDKGGPRTRGPPALLDDPQGRFLPPRRAQGRGGRRGRLRRRYACSACGSG